MTLKSKTNLTLASNSPVRCPALPLVALPKPTPCSLVLLSLCLQPFVFSSPLQPMPACITPLAPRERARVPTPIKPPRCLLPREISRTSSHELQRPASPHSVCSTVLCAERIQHRKRERERGGKTNKQTNKVLSEQILVLQ